MNTGHPFEHHRNVLHGGPLDPRPQLGLLTVRDLEMLAGGPEVSFTRVELPGRGEVRLPPISLRAHHRARRHVLVRGDTHTLQQEPLHGRQLLAGVLLLGPRGTRSGEMKPDALLRYGGTVRFTTDFGSSG